MRLKTVTPLRLPYDLHLLELLKSHAVWTKVFHTILSSHQMNYESKECEINLILEESYLKDNYRRDLMILNLLGCLNMMEYGHGDYCWRG
ncbi:hypothetical protein CUMW_232970 [Citrus unshiu]|uniref:Uncharacterized protein n=1 Tax=Citrus unshiu TaxID=55188 RepID=A0A2H5QJG7_CITUN|nr:hypothetical protein CUMW_232970 [Citrus unshiu]